jgi:hypothetical protein
LLKPTTPQELAMLSVLQRFSSQVSGVLSGFDRLRFRGTKRLLNTPGGMLNFLWHKQILLKQFKEYTGCVAASNKPLSPPVARCFSSTTPNWV